MYKEILHYCSERNVDLIVVSKMRTIDEILHIYHQGQRRFAENRVQNLMERKEALPKDIEWHLIGSLQSNKVKYIAPFISLIHSLDDPDLWKEIDKQAKKNNRIIPCLLQIKVAQEETKSGFEWNELVHLLKAGEWKKYSSVAISGVMGMASLTDDLLQIRSEFMQLKKYFDELHREFFKDNSFNTLSMGMSGDYKIAIDCGATMVRVGSAVFEVGQGEGIKKPI